MPSWAIILMVMSVSLSLSWASDGKMLLDCRKFAFAPICRGVTSKRSLADVKPTLQSVWDNEGNKPSNVPMNHRYGDWKEKASYPKRFNPEIPSPSFSFMKRPDGLPESFSSFMKRSDEQLPSSFSSFIKRSSDDLPPSFSSFYKRSSNDLPPSFSSFYKRSSDDLPVPFSTFYKRSDDDLPSSFSSFIKRSDDDLPSSFSSFIKKSDNLPETFSSFMKRPDDLPSSFSSFMKRTGKHATSSKCSLHNKRNQENLPASFSSFIKRDPELPESFSSFMKRPDELPESFSSFMKRSGSSHHLPSSFTKTFQHNILDTVSPFYKNTKLSSHDFTNNVPLPAILHLNNQGDLSTRVLKNARNQNFVRSVRSDRYPSTLPETFSTFLSKRSHNHLDDETIELPNFSAFYRSNNKMSKRSSTRNRSAADAFDTFSSFYKKPTKRSIDGRSNGGEDILASFSSFYVPDSKRFDNFFYSNPNEWNRRFLHYY